ncbi:hypothetical protein JW960_10550 [candidate division KSB1 bacterium]|nr:hypothetical protein [candidate division KSB1 bacterium]
MKRLTFVYLGCVMLVSATMARGTMPENFRLVALINTTNEYDAPVRLALSPEILTQVNANCTDLRIFDDTGTEVPYVIYALPRKGQATQSYNWKIIQYQLENNEQTIILEKPKNAGVAGDLELLTPDQNFTKTVMVFTSDDRTSWRRIARGSFFDFSSTIALRNTSVHLAGHPDAFLKLILVTDTAAIDSGDEIRLRYKELEFTSKSGGTDEIKINGFISHTDGVIPDSSWYSHYMINSPTTSMDDGNTIIACGRVNVPIEQVLLNVSNKYYYRTVEVWTAQTDDDEAYRFTSRDVIYHIPGIDEPKTTLKFNSNKSLFMRLKIINQDNPALHVEGIDVSWLQRNLYFIPESGRRYSLYFGGIDIHIPQYDVGKLIPNSYPGLLAYPEVRLAAMHENSLYKPTADPRARERLQRLLIMGIVIVIGVGLAYWAFGLVKKIPGNVGEDI